MVRWLAILILLAPLSGCMLLDDYRYDEPPYARVQSPTCGMTPPGVPTVQTAEPEIR